jgi:glycosyltransferase involved in cell wall biosynthesis
MVSIIIPYFNRIPRVLNAIDSVFKQSFDDWELILIDDFSNEDNAPIKECKAGPRNQSITHLTNETNKGPGYSRNRGIEISRGEHILFLDSDDTIKTQFLEKLLNGLTQDKLFIYCTAEWSNGTIYKTSDKSYEKLLPTLLNENRPWHTSAILWNKAHIAFFNESLRNWEDYLFEFSSALNMNEILFVDEKLVKINLDSVDGLSVLSETQLGLIDRLKAIDLMFLEFEKRIVIPQINKKETKRYLLLKFVHFYLKISNANKLIFDSQVLKRIPKSRHFLLVIKKILTYCN